MRLPEEIHKDENGSQAGCKPLDCGQEAFVFLPSRGVTGRIVPLELPGGQGVLLEGAGVGVEHPPMVLTAKTPDFAPRDGEEDPGGIGVVTISVQSLHEERKRLGEKVFGLMVVAEHARDIGVEGLFPPRVDGLDRVQIPVAGAGELPVILHGPPFARCYRPTGFVATA